TPAPSCFSSPTRIRKSSSNALAIASIVITMDTYASWLPNLQASAAEAMSQVFGRALQKVRKGKAA
ncbi:MAG TPA: hypothetical protein VNU22_00005, partial [Candidatus Acidoferrum sp.]|nr:hypothetical protein [Candidatus Acidoferrum sp.]